MSCLVSILILSSIENVLVLVGGVLTTTLLLFLYLNFMCKDLKAFVVDVSALPATR